MQDRGTLPRSTARATFEHHTQLAALAEVHTALCRIEADAGAGSAEAAAVEHVFDLLVQQIGVHPWSGSHMLRVHMTTAA